MSKKIARRTERRSALWRLAALSLALAAPAAVLPVSAAEPAWTPDKPIRFIVPFPAGGGTDVAARIVVQAIGMKLGQAIVVENRAGAAGALGFQAVRQAPADGYTFLVASADTHSIYSQVQANPLFKAQDFVAVAPITRIAFVLMGKPDLPAKSTAEVVALAKKGKLSYATYGIGSASHAAMVLFAGVAGVSDLLHVPYTGAAPAAQALMGGQTDLMMVPMPLAVSNRSRVKPYGVSAQKRSDAMADVPTLAEQGYAVDAEFWIGLLAAAKTPAGAMATVSRAIQEAVADPEVQKKLRALGMTPHQLTQTEYASYVSAEYARWGTVVRNAGIRIEE